MSSNRGEKVQNSIEIWWTQDLRVQLKRFDVSLMHDLFSQDWAGLKSCRKRRVFESGFLSKPMSGGRSKKMLTGK